MFALVVQICGSPSFILAISLKSTVSIFTKFLGLYPLPHKWHNLLDLSFNIARFQSSIFFACGELFDNNNHLSAFNFLNGMVDTFCFAETLKSIFNKLEISNKLLIFGEYSEKKLARSDKNFRLWREAPKN